MGRGQRRLHGTLQAVHHLDAEVVGRETLHPLRQQARHGGEEVDALRTHVHLLGQLRLTLDSQALPHPPDALHRRNAERADLRRRNQSQFEMSKDFRKAKLVHFLQFSNRKRKKTAAD